MAHHAKGDMSGRKETEKRGVMGTDCKVGAVKRGYC